MTDEDEKTQQQAAKHISDFTKAAYLSMLPGMTYALKCLVQELNQLREHLGYGPVTVEGLEEGWAGRPKRGGITEAGRKKLSEMMQRRWEDAKKEGKHVSEYKPPKKNHGGAKKKRTIEKPYPEG